MPVMVCVDGFILTHAFERVDLPVAGGRGRVPAAVRAGAGARSGQADHDRRPGRSRGVHRSESRSRTTSCSGLSSVIPSLGQRVRRALRARRRAASFAPTAPKAPTRSSSRSARSTGRSRRWSMRCAPTDARSGSLDVCTFRPFPFAAVRERPDARRARRRAREERLASGWAASSPPTCAKRLAWTRPPFIPWSQVSAAVPSRGRRYAGRSSRRGTATLEPLALPRSRSRRLVERELAKEVRR